MSVDYKAIYGYGFIVTDSNLQALTAEEYDNFINSDYHICVDGYTDKDSYHFFGLILNEITPGEVEIIPVVDHYNHEDFIKMNNYFKKFFPEQKFYCRHYLIHQIC